MPLSVGTRLGRYELLAPIGKGGMGEVWRARDPRLNRDVAIKISEERFSERFEREARAIAALNHPHICQIYDIGPDYLVLEYVEGAPVKGPLPNGETVKVALQITSALETAHAQGILHRDLKPGNILMSQSGAKLLDFGLAKLIADADATQTIGIAGTPVYMSPEQAEGEPLDVRSDVFSFGAVLYELLAGRRAFDSLAAVLRDEPRALEAPADLQAIVTRCLHKNAAERFASIAEVKTALEKVHDTPAERQPSIAVLPFADMSPTKDQEYFSDGLAEEIINVLAHIPDLKVIARTSAFAFKGQNTDIRRIAETLGVTNVLEGSVRKAGKRIRVTAQLIDASDGRHLWSERYDRELEDVFAIQDEIAEAIAQALRVRLSSDPAAHRHHTPLLAAYEAFLKARHFIQKWTPQAIELGRQCYLEAIALDPQFAAAHSGLGLHYFSLLTENQIPAREAAEQMNTAARQALAIDASVTEAHAVLALVAVLNYNWEEAGKHFQVALAHPPVSPLVRYFYSSFYLNALGNAPEAAEQIKQALVEDPLNLLLRMSAGLRLAGADDDAAEPLLRGTIEFDEHAWIPMTWLAHFCFRRGRMEEAIALQERAHALVPNHRAVIGQLAGILSCAGDTQRAEMLHRRLTSAYASGVPAGLFGYHMARGETDLAAPWLEKAIEQRDTRAPWILPHLFGHQFTSSPHWPRLAKMMNLPQKDS